uniref:Uncharacterized protein n=1 Tax=Tanacetum cinerariifolium TaxID=118510 RepID=A0A6L2KRZ1_TANCI|nr:hypothetical protein [Tanacetum cinerariifolium]
MDANKKVDFENSLCLDKSKILADILKNHPLIFNIVASSSVPWIYLGKFWHTLHEDGSNIALGRISLLLKSPTLIPYLRFTKLIASHYMAAYPEISRRVRNTYHNLADDVMIKSIFNLGKSKVESTQGTHRKPSAPRSPNHVVAEVESSAPQRNDDDQVDPGTRLEPRSDKESPEVEKIVDMS